MSDEHLDFATTPPDGLPSVLYRELRGLARRQVHQGGAPVTLEPTALVHEAWIRMSEGGAGYEGRGHFLASAVVAMRCVLADRARAARALRRGGDRAREPLEGMRVEVESSSIDLVALDEALTRLAEKDSRKADVVTLRFLIGCTVEETAESLGLSPATVKREWTFARAWMHRELGP